MSASFRCNVLAPLAIGCAFALPATAGMQPPFPSAPPPASGCTASWTSLFGTGPSVDGNVQAATVFDDGNGPALYVGGGFANIGGVAASRIAKWNGTSWSALGTGLGGGVVLALAVYDDGGGPALYAGGTFTSAGGSGANYVAKWNGASWSALGTGMAGTSFPLTTQVVALAVHDDGGGPALYAGGVFTSAGGNAANFVARWNGSAWSALGSGMSGGPFQAVWALAVHDDGGGAELYAGGQFTSAGGGSASRIAKWDGAGWSALGSGASQQVTALASHDDGSGPALYAGGSFTVAGGATGTNRVARWDGASWSELDGGMTTGQVDALAVYDQGAGPELFAGGDFTDAGGSAASRIARWDGAGWSTLDAGVNDFVYCLATYDDGGGSALYVGGMFTTSPAGDARLAKWLGCGPAPGLGTPYCFGDGSGTPCPCGNTGGAGEGCQNGSGQGAVLSATGTASAAADDAVFLGEHLLPGQPALFFGALNAINGGAGVHFGDGLRCAGGGLVRLGVKTPNAMGEATWGPGLGATGGWTSGDTRRFQVWYRNPGTSPCTFNFNLSHGLEITFVP